MSGKKEFDVKQILRLRWRWFSHSSQGSAGSGGGGGGGVGGYIQQDGLDHRGTPVQGRLKSHSRDRGIGGGGLRKSNSPVHSILAPTPGPTPVYVRAGHQSWHQQQNTIQGLQVSEEPPKSSSSPSATRKEDANNGQENVKGCTEDPAEVEARERYDSYEVLETLRRQIRCREPKQFPHAVHLELAEAILKDAIWERITSITCFTVKVWLLDSISI